MAGVCVMDWTTWRCVLCANLPPQSRLICVCLFFHWNVSLLAQCHNAFADPCFALHVRELFSPPGSDSVSSWSAGRLTRSVKSYCNFARPAFRFCHDQSQPPSIPASPLDHRPTNRLCYDRSQLLSIQPSQLDLLLSSRLRELGIGFHLSSKRSCRGGKRKQRKISVVSGVRVTSTTSSDVRRSPRTRSEDSRHPAPVTDVAADVPPRSRTSYSSRGVSFANLIPVSVKASTATSSPPTQSKIIKVLYFNSQSCRQKASDIHEMILDDGTDTLLMTQTWLYAKGDEACIAEMTPRGYVLRSFPRTGSRGGGIALIVRDAFCEVHLSNPCPFSLSRPSSFISLAGTCPYRLCACTDPLPAGKTNSPIS